MRQKISPRRNPSPEPLHAATKTFNGVKFLRQLENGAYKGEKPPCLQILQQPPVPFEPVALFRKAGEDALHPRPKRGAVIFVFNMRKFVNDDIVNRRRLTKD